MAKRKSKQAKKFVKKHPVLSFVLFLLVISIVGVYVLHQQKIIHLSFLDKLFPNSSPSETLNGEGGAFTEEDILTIKGSDVSIHFLELGQ